jgi:acyl-coenzyme A thioesterase PaaI-like protein
LNGKSDLIIGNLITNPYNLQVIFIRFDFLSYSYQHLRLLPLQVRETGTNTTRYHLISASQPHPGFDTHTMNSLKLVDASSKGTVTYHLLIDPSMSNLNGVMHGGAAGVVFDMATMSALGPLSRKGYWDFLGGVTRILNLSFLRGVPVGMFFLTIVSTSTGH